MSPEEAMGKEVASIAALVHCWRLPAPRRGSATDA